jgi:hypothetical protein
MIRARTIKDAAAYFKTVDPQTALTEYAIRTLLRTGKVPCVRMGKKYLVTIEALEAYLASDDNTVVRPRERESRKEWRIP